MQTILGASGQIGIELARALHRNYTTDIRIVSRNPAKVNPTDSTLSADLLNAQQTARAVEGSSVVYLTAGLPMDTERWEQQWPVIMRNVIDACKAHDAKLVFFDNTYMYPQTAEPQTEDILFEPHGRKGQVRADIAQELICAQTEKDIVALIARAPEFYGPEKTQSITQSTLIEPLKRGKKARVFLRDDTQRSLIYTPDASRALALLGNTPDAFDQTWHLPCDDNRLTYRGMVETIETITQKPYRYSIVKPWQLKLASVFSKTLRDAQELMPRYQVDNVFISDKFKARFPEFSITSYQEGLKACFD
ncbi:NAD-dependent epimerase/dehydratase family protein [Idiomarina sp. UBA3162]|uniref:NAD-dependent epimerase/dehydratase family protein n=1 Tax=Idiomarina sp. UBA3162 TaxID=1946641 RepID=UPI000C90915E|nr:NAD-dependent epimerase/dehydratase family protein [Idiomarina sp. UBA3162]MAD52814.1 NAD-dependent epimerase [Idiomarinaceae bacterium]|tara:strand:- start:2809 stop:3726 length:918 start_codon:yes stop_codon:yes gene_type:complete